MSKPLVVLIALAVVIAGAGVGAMGFLSNSHAKQEKPTLYMTPSDLFQNRRLRQLAQAAQHGNAKKISGLIAQGVNVNGHGKYGIGPLFSAVQAGNKLGFETLLNRGADPNNVWTNGHTLLNVIACCTHDPYFMEQALKHGANSNLVEPKTGMTPIMAAVTVSGKVNIPPLIRAGANLNHQIPSGKGSPLFPIAGETAMMGATGDMFDVVYKLLEAGADYRLKDDRGWNLADYIKYSFRATVSSDQAHWRDKVIEFLKKHNTRSVRSSASGSQSESGDPSN